jgi:tetratricopeptide (TPR) repeat protein
MADQNHILRDKDGFRIPGRAMEAAEQSMPGDRYRPPRDRPTMRSRGGRWLLAVLVLVGLGLGLGNAAARAWIGNAIAETYVLGAQKHLDRGDVRGAVSSLDSAIYFAAAGSAMERRLRLYRAELQVQSGEAEAAEQDLSALIAEIEGKTTPDASEQDVLRSALGTRGTALSRLRRMKEAAASVDRMAELSGDEPMALNNSAWFRAVGEFELDRALADATRAVEMTNRREATYLDTLGYLQHKHGDQAEAVKTLSEAIELERERLLQLGSRQRRRRGDVFEMQRRQESLAVYLHHRALAHRAGGDEASAARDEAAATEHGYRPELEY